MLPPAILFNLWKLHYYQVQRQQHIQRASQEAKGAWFSSFCNSLLTTQHEWLYKVPLRHCILCPPSQFHFLLSLHYALPPPASFRSQSCQDLSCLTISFLPLRARESLLGGSYSCQLYVQCTHFWFNFIQQWVARSHAVLFGLLEPSTRLRRWKHHQVSHCIVLTFVQKMQMQW